MNDSRRNNYSFDEQLELMPQMTLNSGNSFAAIEFTHDYVSTDSEYGRKVIKNYIHSLALNIEMGAVILLSDKATKLLSDEELLNDFIILSESHPIYVAESAIEEYKVDIPENISLQLTSDSEFIQVLIEFHPLVVS